jgi:hypothetical protein
MAERLHAFLQNCFNPASTSDLKERAFKMIEDVNIVTVTRKPGEISIFISPDDMILSKIASSSSARNSFEGNVI